MGTMGDTMLALNTVILCLTTVGAAFRLLQTRKGKEKEPKAGRCDDTSKSPLPNLRPCTSATSLNGLRHSSHHADRERLQAELDSLHKAIAVINHLAAELDIERAMKNIRAVALELLDCDKVTLFLVFGRRKEIRGKTMDDDDFVIKMKFGQGIAGRVAETGEVMNVKDAYSHPLFNPDVDRKTGYRTRNLLCCAIRDLSGKTVAVLQAVNKKVADGFNEADERNLRLFGTHLANTLSKAKMHEKAKRDKARLLSMYNCFRALNSATDLGKVLDITTDAIQEILASEFAIVFLMDTPRGELWTQCKVQELDDLLCIRVKVGQGLVGKCAAQRTVVCLTERPSKRDPVLSQLRHVLPSGALIKSLLLQPVVMDDKVLAVVLAINKREEEGSARASGGGAGSCGGGACHDMFFEDYYTESDCDAMQLLALEIGSILSDRSLEVALASALSVVGSQGVHTGKSGVEAAPGGHSRADALAMQSQLVNMYYQAAPEYKSAPPGAAPSPRSSFSINLAGQRGMRWQRVLKKVVAINQTGATGCGASTCSLRDLLTDEDSLSAPGRNRRASVGSSTAALQFSYSTRTSSPGKVMPPRASLVAAATHPRSSSTPSLVTVDGTGGTSGAEVEAAQLSSQPAGCLQGLMVGSRLQVRSSASHDDMVLEAMASEGNQLRSSIPSSSRTTESEIKDAHVCRPLHLERDADELDACGAVAEVAGPGTAARSFGGWHRHQDEASLSEDTCAGSGGSGDEAHTHAGAHRRPHTQPDPHEEEGHHHHTYNHHHHHRHHHAHHVHLPARHSSPRHHSHSQGSSRHSHHQHSQHEAQHSASVTASLLLNGSTIDSPRANGTMGETPTSPARASSPLERGSSGRWGGLALSPKPPMLVHQVSSASDRLPASPSSLFYKGDVLRTWDFDFTQFQDEELVKLCYDMFLMSGVVHHFSISPKVLRAFLVAVSSHYHDIPYHNFNHVVHVMHGAWMLLQMPPVCDTLTMLDKLALLLAALCHDLDHDGHTNSYHVNTQSELARIYNDISVQENHHCAMTTAILSKKECALLEQLTPEQQKALRKALVAAILCTDMANHYTLTQDFTKHPARYDPESEADRLLLIKVILHSSDIGSAVRPFTVNDAMSKRVHHEFQLQAEIEARLGLPITFAVDRADRQLCAQVECNFLEYVVTPLWSKLVEVIPTLKPQYEVLLTNIAIYKRLAAGDDDASALAAVAASLAAGSSADAAAGGEGVSDAGGPGGLVSSTSVADLASIASSDSGTVEQGRDTPQTPSTPV